MLAAYFATTVAYSFGLKRLALIDVFTLACLYTVRVMAGGAATDIYLSYWSSPAIAHTLLSFGFADGRHVVFSGEIRREHHEVFSSIGGFFREFELAMIAAEERDIIYLRTNIRKEDVYRYQVKLPPGPARQLFLSYVERGNQLAAKAEFYNTLTTNCTTKIWLNSRVNPDHLPLRWQVLLSGFLPRFLYDSGRLDSGGLSFEQLQRRSLINERAQAADQAPDFSRRIRDTGASEPER